MRIDFYVLESTHPDAIKKVAARLLLKAYKSNLRTWVRCDNQAFAEALDDWLWTDEACDFLPHCLTDAIPEGLDPPIQVTYTDEAPNGTYDILLNLSETLPPQLTPFKRILDIVPQEKKAAGRARYKAYQAQNATLAHHTVP